MKRFYHGYRISRGYTRCVVWVFGKMTNSLVSTNTHIPHKHFSRRQRYNIICKFLMARDIPCPCYKPPPASTPANPPDPHEVKAMASNNPPAEE